MTDTSQQLASAQMEAHSSSIPPQGNSLHNVGADLFNHPFSNSDEQQIPPRSQTKADVLKGSLPQLFDNLRVGAMKKQPIGLVLQGAETSSVFSDWSR